MCYACQKQRDPSPISRDQWALPVRRQSRKVKGKDFIFLFLSSKRKKKEFVEVTHGRKEKELFCGEEQKEDKYY
ncbi:hypothetical protein CEXT_46791 [Caerostris extrusa]|uniref:Uncharacterized protein n=1 Tax=Caerostris extrusa TaxID=172846 RepID=A0AAV4VMW9_CAEEX|nr:hypothetical protein CEXT_46791 [Caerostris extrusa]